MGLEHAMLAAEVSGTEPTISHDALGRLFAVLECTADLLWRTTTQRSGEMHGALGGDVVCGQRLGQEGEVLAGVHYAQLGLGHADAKSEERAQIANRGGLRDVDGEGCNASAHGYSFHSQVIRTVACEVLDEDLHRLFRLGRLRTRGCRRHACNTVGPHLCCVLSLVRVQRVYVASWSVSRCWG